MTTDRRKILAAYMLHDADLHGVLALESGEAMIWLRLDTVWNPGAPPCVVAVVRRAYRLRWSGGRFRMSTIDVAVSAPLSLREREDLLEDRSLDYSGADPPSFDDGLTRTRLCCINSMELELLHGAELRVILGD
jgi:hypothetical protein